jgi:glycine oxidase
MNTPSLSSGQRALIVGGGIVGCGAALRLAQRGVDVIVLERGSFGDGAASRAAAGILGAQLEAHPNDAMRQLCLASRRQYGDWIAELEDASDIDTGYRRCGAIQIAFGPDELRAIDAAIEAQEASGLRVERLDAAQALELEPELNRELAAAAWFEDDGVVDPPAMLRAARVAAERAGAVFREAAHVVRLIRDADVTRGVVIDGGAKLEADVVVLAAGSWSSLVQNTGLGDEQVRPVRGQIIELTVEQPWQRAVIDGPGAYLSPRRDGRILVGATVEEVGFLPGVTAEGMQGLLTAALRIVPRLAKAKVSGSWSGFRAATPNRLPLFYGSGASGLVVATGHFRNGILLAPLSAQIVASLVFDEAPPVDLSPFGLAAR